MSTIGKLSVVIDADTKGLNAGLKGASTSLAKFNKKISASIVTMAKFGAAAVAAGSAFAAMKLVKITREFDVLNAGLSSCGWFSICGNEVG